MRPDSDDHADVEDFRADAPLLQQESDQNDSNDNIDNRPERGEGDGEETSSEASLGEPGWFIFALTCAAGVSGLLFGYDTGVISSALLSLSTSLNPHQTTPLTTWDKSIITSSTSLLALLASPPASLLADALGRKPVILLADALFILGALLQASARSVTVLVVGRAVVGAAIGAASFATPLYISEIAPARQRGRLVTVQVLAITVGQVLAYVVGWGFSGMDGGWRWMFGLGAAPGVLQVGLMAVMEETPRWLVANGRVERARRILRRVYGGGSKRQTGEQVERVVEGVLKKVERQVREEEIALRGRRGVDEDGVGAPKTSLWKRRWESLTDGFTELFNVTSNRSALGIACLLQGFQQLCGFNSLMYFSATIFALLGFHDPTLVSLTIATTNLLFTLVAFIAIDRVGRRGILLYSVPVMVIGLVLASVAFSQEGRLGLSGSDEQKGGGGGPWAIVILCAMIVYVAGYAIGIGNVPWQQSELFPLPVRAAGSALATSTNWGANFLVGLTFLPMLELLSPAGTFGVYAVVCVVGWVAVWRWYPERSGIGLEEVGGRNEEEIART
ncbi:general substrate transporter [Aulographum hederae CBS 113979]|uniref:General substrate transporter n=1 Tax=Aulographum hederae CBS 113979 TaxID=1176131 RepID=A0A6G1H4Q1_9PEZI|nr:general substrate transporter [Aulographum hederae CBS 113979]